ncbi:MAG: GTPase KRas precursor [Candidatus Heimdallarchaeota archaeon LC_3]|nr:MAG: GTPase KRas precursor [Candidatus Heimdallarchaeota archaeon LC_3]
MYKIVLCGDGAVGKTALRLRYMGRGFQAKYMMTIGADFALKEISVTDNLGNSQTFKFQLWDLAGQQNFSSVRPLYYMGAHGAILVYDVTRLSTFENTASWIAEITKGIGKKLYPIVLIANKIDFRRQSDIAITAEEGRELARRISDEEFDGKIKIPYIETSAKTGENVDDAFLKIAELTNHTYK